MYGCPALYDEIRQFREACGEAHMKTILAIGELANFTNVYKASLVSMMAGESLMPGAYSEPKSPMLL